ncbi:MAG: HRDC domain-containing protein, partial [Muribaculaceae bacterium]|nr:HRDC domain-containing protein [Muribaculaceae bacterium]
YPITLEELKNIPGVGAGKAARYGREFVELIDRHVKENEIERPRDLRVKTVANNSKIKILLIQAIDRKISLDEFARANKMDYLSLLDELESIVNSGTKLNIDYYLKDLIDPDSQQDIFDYFRSAETDDLVAAYHEFDEEFSEEELRLMRIKFMSEMAN